MAITVKHNKVSLIPDAGDDSLIEPSDWNADHTLTGLGTMAEQNANAVAITGGTISGVTLPASNITGTLGVPNGGTGASTLTGYVKGTGTTAMTAAATIPNTDITGLGTASTKDAGAANGVATLDAGGKVPVSELPAAVLGALSYQGTWDASTNTPTLTSSVGTKGYYYVVSVAGNTNLNGITDWLVGDWAVYNGTVWQKVDNTDAGGDVVGPASATDNAIARFDTTTGKLIQNSVVTMDDTGVIAGATLTSPKINEILDANGNEVLGLLSTASATDYLAIKNGIGVGVPLHISSEGSSANIGLHIQPKGTGLVTISDGTDFNKGIRFRSSGSAASAITLLDAVSSAGHVITLPDATTTLVGRGTTDTLTNKSISGSTNTLSNIGNSSLTNSAITINGTSTSLGGSINVGTVTSVDLTASTGISVSGGPITGSGSITVTNTAPDQTVVLTAGTGISTSGTYPNFTITNTAPSSGGTVTSVAALTIGTTGTDLSSTVANGTTTPVITLQVPTASATNRGALSSTDWSTFNGKANAFTYTTNYIPYGQGTTTPTQSANLTFNGTTLTATDITDSSLTAGRVTYAGTGGNLVDSSTFTFASSTLTAPIVSASNGLVVNSNTVSASYTIPSGSSAMSAGPMTIASGQTVTVSSGSRWVVL